MENVYIPPIYLLSGIQVLTHFRLCTFSLSPFAWPLWLYDQPRPFVNGWDASGPCWAHEEVTAFIWSSTGAYLCSDELHMPSIIYEGRPENLPWGSVNSGTPDINKSLTKARGVCLYCKLGGNSNYTKGKEAIKWILVASHQGQMQCQSKCAFNIHETFRANILQSVLWGQFKLFWLPVTNHSWSKLGWLTSPVGIVLRKLIILHYNTIPAPCQSPFNCATCVWHIQECPRRKISALWDKLVAFIRLMIWDKILR